MAGVGSLTQRFGVRLTTGPRGLRVVFTKDAIRLWKQVADYCRVWLVGRKVRGEFERLKLT